MVVVGTVDALFKLILVDSEEIGIIKDKTIFHVRMSRVVRSARGKLWRHRCIPCGSAAIFCITPVFMIAGDGINGNVRVINRCHCANPGRILRIQTGNVLSPSIDQVTPGDNHIDLLRYHICGHPLHGG
jgi:hypothetical protein